MHPAKATEWNEMPFDRDTCVVPSNTVYRQGPGQPTERGDLGVKTPVSSDAAYCQSTLAIVYFPPPITSFVHVTDLSGYQPVSSTVSHSVTIKVKTQHKTMTNNARDKPIMT